jgi:hypothetical protein
MVLIILSKHVLHIVHIQWAHPELPPTPRPEARSAEQAITEGYFHHSSHWLHSGCTAQLRYDDQV